MQWLVLPGGIASPPKHGAPPGAWQSLGLAALSPGAVHPGHVPCAARHGCYNNGASHAARGKAGEDHPGIGRAVEHEYRSVRIQEPRSLSWQAAIPRERSTCPLLAGCALMSLVTS